MRCLLRQTIVSLLILCGSIEGTAILYGVSGQFTDIQEGFLSVFGFSNPGPAGGFLSLCLISAVGLFAFCKNRPFQFLLAAIIAIIAASLFLTCSRAAWIASFVGILSVLSYRYGNYLRRLATKKKKLFLTGMTVAAAITAAGLYMMRPGSVNGRLLIWRVCIDMIAERPLFGFGFNGFTKNYMLHQAEYFDRSPDSFFVPYADDSVYVFNEPLHILVDWGLFGFGICLLFIYSLFKTSSPDNISRILKSVLCGWIIFSFFSYPLSEYPLFAAMVMICISLEINCSGIKQLKVVTTVALMAVLVIGTVSYMSECSMERKLEKLCSGGKVDESVFFPDRWQIRMNPQILNEYSQICALNCNSEQRRRAIISAKDYVPSYANWCAYGDMLAKDGVYDEALSVYAKASEMIPLRLRPRYRSFLIHFNNEEWNRAEQVGQVILDLPIKIRGSEAILILADIKVKMRK